MPFVGPNISKLKKFHTLKIPSKLANVSDGFKFTTEILVISQHVH